LVVKVLAFWDVPLGKEEAYAKFFAETAPSIMKGLEKLGLRIVGRWETIIGSGPRIVYEYEFDDFKSLAKFFESKEYLEMRRKMAPYRANFSNRVLVPFNQF